VEKVVLQHLSPLMSADVFSSIAGVILHISIILSFLWVVFDEHLYHDHYLYI
jgi:hypothetical protein